MYDTYKVAKIFMNQPKIIVTCLEIWNEGIDLAKCCQVTTFEETGRERNHNVFFLWLGDNGICYNVAGYAGLSFIDKQCLERNINL